jgi:hypothetical protein
MTSRVCAYIEQLAHSIRGLVVFEKLHDEWTVGNNEGVALRLQLARKPRADLVEDLVEGLLVDLSELVDKPDDNSASCTCGTSAHAALHESALSLFCNAALTLTSRRKI